VIEDGYKASGETGRTTAHITHALDDRYYNLEQKHGLDGARNAANSCRDLPYRVNNKRRKN
jgi:hypothetical protein